MRAGAITFFIAGKLENPLNGRLSRAHWTTKSRWANGWKARTLIAMRPVGRELILLNLEGPKRVTFTAYVGAQWDDDNLPAALKPCRDQLVHSGVISGDAPKDGHTFIYRQVVQRGIQAKRGVEVRIRCPQVRLLGGAKDEL